jgi:hypothetical protein
MPRRSGKIPIGRGGPPPLEFGASDWQRIEKASGLQLLPGVRDEIAVVTAEAQAASFMEMNADRAGDAKEHLVEFREAVKRLVDAIPARNFGATSYARGLVYNRMRGDSWRDPQSPAYFEDPVETLARRLESWVAACDDAIAELDNPDFVIREGEGWNLWIIRLTRIFRNNGLPTGVRSDDLGSPSPFVLLVDQIQRYFAGRPPKAHSIARSDC